VHPGQEDRARGVELGGTVMSAIVAGARIGAAILAAVISR
jgi:hypothetical protein